LLGAGLPLLLSGVLLEALTLVVRQWVSFPIPLTWQMRAVLTVPLVVTCLSGMIWFHRSLDLIGVRLLDGKNELITSGPFAYVRHPLYSTLIVTMPPLAIVWFSDLLFLIPWALLVIVSHHLVSLEERELIDEFGQAYEGYRECVPALLPYKGAGGRRYREQCNGSAARPFE
jgi:protein-S-isoprenylcysteine O-methyltransferase Ste14